MELHRRESGLQPDDPIVRDLPLRFGFTALAVIALGALVALGALSPRTLTIRAIGPIPLSLVLAAVLIAFAILLTGTYVLIANRNAGRP